MKAVIYTRVATTAQLGQRDPIHAVSTPALERAWRKLYGSLVAHGQAPPAEINSTTRILMELYRRQEAADAPNPHT